MTADYLLIQFLGFNHESSKQFFLLSSHSHLLLSKLCCSLFSFKIFQQLKKLFF
nr:MAG TPA: hypothetical protein [Siphoviridae sp. ctngg6]